MPRAALLERTRRASSIGALVLGALACGGAPHAGALAAGPGCAAFVEGAAARGATALEVCEAAIAARVYEGEPTPRELVQGYVDARRAALGDDAWGAAWDALEAVAPTERSAVVLVEHGAPASSVGKSIAVAALPATGALDADVVLVAFADAASCGALTRVTPSGARVALGHDPLAPFAPPVPPVVAVAPGKLDADLALEADVRAAVDAASGGRYVDAARAADRARARLGAASEDSAARARVLLERMRASGLLLDAPRGAASSLASGDRAAASTGYGAYARITASGGVVDATLARAVVAAARPGDRARVEALLQPVACSEKRADARALHPHDLVFAAARLAEAPRSAAEIADAADALASLLTTSERARAGFAYAPLAMAARGVDARGAAPAMLTLVEGLRALVKAEPARVSSVAAIGLATRAAMKDAALARELTALAEEAAAARVGSAETAAELLATAAATAFSSANAPAELRGPLLSATLRAAEAKLGGDLRSAGGFDVAALVAADAAARALTSQPVDLARTADDLGRALAHGSSRPELAAVVGALARYASVSARDRAADKRALRAAIAGLGAPGEAPDNLLDDVTDLGDGLAAALAAEARARGAKALADRAKPAAACDARDDAANPELRRALAPLGDVRQRIVSHPRFRGGDGAWVRRARLLVTLLSDALDYAQKDARAGAARHGSALAIPAADARSFVAGALSDGELGPYAKAVGGAYAIARAIAVDRGRKGAPTPTGADVARVAEDLASGAASSTGGARILAALALAGSSDAKSDDAVSPLLARWARALSAAGNVDEADLCLLLSLLVEAATDAPPSQDVLEVARSTKSRVDWALELVAETDGARLARRAPDPSRFAGPLAAAIPARACDAKADEPVAVEASRALADATTGHVADAARRADAILARAEATGLDVPRVAYRYEARAPGRVVGLSIDASSGFGWLVGATNFQLDFGVTQGEGAGEALTAAPSSPAADAARFYVSLAALASAWNFVGGDARAGVHDAARAVSATTHGVRLGERRVLPDEPFAWAADARGALAIAGELAADRGDALLAGDLWTLITRSIACPRACPTARRGRRAGDDRRAANATDDRSEAERTLEAALDRPPPGFEAGAPAVVHARRTLGALARALPCGPDRDAAGFEEAACDAYGRALGLRAADALHAHPRLKRGGKGALCGAFADVDRFLEGADRKEYDPDAFTRAVHGLERAGLVYDAAALLARYKKKGQCSGIPAIARRLARAPELDPGLAADLWTESVNCTAGSAGPGVVGDLVALDDATARLADPARNLRVLLAGADLAAHDARWDVLSALASRPGFVARWIGVDDVDAAAALVVARAARVADRRLPEDPDAALAERLVCSSPPPERARLCDAARELEKPKADAKEAAALLGDVVAHTSAAPKRP